MSFYKKETGKNWVSGRTCPGRSFWSGWLCSPPCPIQSPPNQGHFFWPNSCTQSWAGEDKLAAEWRAWYAYYGFTLNVNFFAWERGHLFLTSDSGCIKFCRIVRMWYSKKEIVFVSIPGPTDWIEFHLIPLKTCHIQIDVGVIHSTWHFKFPHPYISTFK